MKARLLAIPHAAPERAAEALGAAYRFLIELAGRREQPQSAPSATAQAEDREDERTREGGGSGKQ